MGDVECQSISDGQCRSFSGDRLLEDAQRCESIETISATADCGDSDSSAAGFSRNRAGSDSAEAAAAALTRTRYTPL